MQDYGSVSIDRITEILKDIKNKARQENYWLELKKGESDLKPNQICAFLNHDGGVILIGIGPTYEFYPLHSSTTPDSVRNKIVREFFPKWGNNKKTLLERIEVMSFKFEDNRLVLLRIHPLIGDFVVLEGRIYDGRSLNGEEPNQLTGVHQIKSFVAKRLTMEWDVREYLCMLDHIEIQVRALEKWIIWKTAEFDTDKLTRGVPGPQILRCDKILPKSLRLGEYGRLRRKIFGLLVVDIELERIEKTFFENLKLADNVIGKNPESGPEKITKIDNFELVRLRSDLPVQLNQIREKIHLLSKPPSP